jgi:hypothetical protein
MRLKLIAAALLAAILTANAAAQTPAGSAFTYQGVLESSVTQFPVPAG